MAQSSQTAGQGDDAAAKAEAERREAERQEAERRRAEQQRAGDQRSTTQAAADQRNANPPRDDGKNVMERGQERAVGEAEQPVPTQDELDAQKERVMHPGVKPATEDRAMQSGSGRPYQTR